jgi:hypothetical protein
MRWSGRGGGPADVHCVHEVYNRYTSHGRDAAEVLPSLRAHGPESLWQSSPRSSVRKTSERCLRGEVYPSPDLARRANERALRKDSFAQGC